jgi:GT2 family glycosyltransferase
VVDDAGDPPADSAIEPRFFDELDLRVVRLDANGGPARARNRGVEESSAPWIVFIDDDVMPSERMLEVHLAAIRSAPGGMTVSLGPFAEPSDWKATPWNMWEARQAAHETACLQRRDYDPTWRQFHTGNNALSRALFHRAGGFDESFLRAEDDEFAARLSALGVSFAFEPEAVGWHYSERSLEAWLAIPAAYASFDVQIDRMYPHEHYLERKLRELASRHVLLRVARKTFTALRSTDLGIRIATASGRSAYQLGLRSVAMDCLSVAYDLAYCSALARALTSEPAMLKPSTHTNSAPS